MVNNLFRDDRSLECGCAVASGAIRPEFATMHVVPLVTGYTASGQACVCHILLGVTAVASNFRMGALQLEMRVSPVIEVDL